MVFADITTDPRQNECSDRDRHPQLEAAGRGKNGKSASGSV